MELDKGKLLYDESYSFKKRKQLKKIGIIVSLTIIIIIIILDIYIFLNYLASPELFDIMDSVRVLLPNIILLTASPIYLVSALGLDYLRIYEKGFTNPDRNYKQTLRRNENFIPYKDVNEIYPNGNNRLHYMTVIIKSDPRPIRIFIASIKDIDKFLEIINSKVNIVLNRDYKIL